MGRYMHIHNYAKQGDIEGVALELSKGIPVDSVDGPDQRTPLMCAVASSRASVEMVRFLIDRGADVNAFTHDDSGCGADQAVLGLAVQMGDLDKIRLLLDAGADIKYRTTSGYDALINAMSHGVTAPDETLLPIIELLIERGAPTSGISGYSESALRVASRVGRFDVVRILLEAGADPRQLEWTDFMHAIALGSLPDVEQALAAGVNLEARDFWDRTPWLLSLQTGDLGKAKLLLASGVDRSARGRCGMTPMMYAIENRHVDVLEWLLEEGFDPEATDDFETTPLMCAAEYGATECVKLLLKSGANPAATDHIGWRAIKKASRIEIVRLLLAAGEDLNDIDDEMRAEMTGVDYEGELQVSRDEYLVGKERRFGSANPEVIEVPFWKAMVRSGVIAYRARDAFDDNQYFRDAPVWCFHRFGKSITELPDGRFVEIAGEHEASYDPDFCIYNDVIVHHGGGKFDILGYPREVFPPTDFHSATLVGDSIYIIGSIGYVGERLHGETPVYRLHCGTFAMAKVETTGEKPGWISGHRASLKGESEIVLSGGEVCVVVDGAEESIENPDSYVLNLVDRTWRRVRKVS
jgi:ankyrin repeat protein